MFKFGFLFSSKKYININICIPLSDTGHRWNLKNCLLKTTNPARQKGWLCQCGNKLDRKYKCPPCGNKYKMTVKQGLQKLK